MSESRDIDAALVLFSLRLPVLDPKRKTANHENERKWNSPQRFEAQQHFGNGSQQKSVPSKLVAEQSWEMHQLSNHSRASPYIERKNSPLTAEKECQRANSSNNSIIANQPYSERTQNWSNTNRFKRSFNDQDKTLLPSLPSLLKSKNIGGPVRRVYSPVGNNGPRTSSRDITNSSLRRLSDHETFTAYGKSAISNPTASFMPVPTYIQNDNTRHRIHDSSPSIEGLDHRTFQKKNSYQELVDMIPVINPVYYKDAKSNKTPFDPSKLIKDAYMIDTCTDKNTRKEAAVKRLRVHGRFAKQAPAFMPISCINKSMAVLP